MEDFLPYTVFVFLTANGKPTGYSFTYSSNQNAQLSDPEKKRLWNEDKLQLQETIVNTLSNPDVNTTAPITVTSKEIDASAMDTKLLKRIEELNFQALQQEEEV